MAKALKTNNMAYKMKGPSLIKGKKNGSKVDLTKTPVGPRATKKPFDRKKFEEETRVAQGMENVEQELFSSKTTHDIVKKNIKNKTSSMKKNSAFTLKSGNKPSMAKLSGVQKSPMKEVPQSEEQKKRNKTRQEFKEDEEARNEKIMFDSNATPDQKRAARLRQQRQLGIFLSEEEKKFLKEFNKKKKKTK